ncbi:putative reverse transcriptase domain-containing protein [Tanacetum coccineum]|uniref:Reverse transcriptase domain-containing protein n=1 Tax=Tanacetum coccineum TaxID=301880 RepID=A0ABQ5FDY3_9ASTR
MSDGGFLHIIAYGYDGLLMQPVAPPSPDYVPGPEHPPSPDYVPDLEHPPSPDYMPGPEHPPSPVEVPYVLEPEYPKYLVPSNAEEPLEDQPLPTDASPNAYVTASADSDPDEDPDEDPEEDHTDYPADGGGGDDEPSDDDDDDDTNDEDEEPFEDEDDDDKEEEHLALADSSVVPVVDLFPQIGIQRHLRRMSLHLHPDSTSTKVPLLRNISVGHEDCQTEPPMSNIHEARSAEYATAHLHHHTTTAPLSLLVISTTSISSPPLHLHHHPLNFTTTFPHIITVTIITTTSLTIHTTTSQPADYGFIDTMYVEIRRQRAKEVGYGIRDVWVDPTEAVEEVAPTTLEGVNARVTELAAVQEQDTQDEALVSREAWAHSVGLSLAVHYELQAYRTHTQMQDYDRFRHLQTRDQTQAMIPRELVDLNSVMDCGSSHVIKSLCDNNMPPRRTVCYCLQEPLQELLNCCLSAYETAAAVKQLIEARVSAALANHETLRNSTNGHGDGSHNSDTGTRGTVRTPLFHINNCVMENQVKFATCTFLGNALAWWNSHIHTVTQDVAYAMEWKTLKKIMTVKYCPRGEIKKLEIELWNLKVKGTNVASYTLCFQELALMCKRMFHEELGKVEKYVGGLPDMIRGNVMSYQPKTMEKAIKFANDIMIKKSFTITERKKLSIRGN